MSRHPPCLQACSNSVRLPPGPPLLRLRRFSKNHASTCFSSRQETTDEHGAAQPQPKESHHRDAEFAEKSVLWFFLCGLCVSAVRFGVQNSRRSRISIM